jgi:serine/threonine protein phosphatase PrpC
MRLRVGACTSAGRQRPVNEDYLLYRIATAEPDAVRHCSLFVAADGVGGNAGGAIASELAARTVAEAFPRDGGTEPSARLAAAIAAADEAVTRRAAAEPSLAGMATTLVAAVVRDGRVWMANIGDSRGYIVRGGRAEQITEDHSLVEESVRAGTLSRAAAAASPYRHVITRSLGGRDPAVVDTFGPRRLQTGDRLLLCTDGLTETVMLDVIARLASRPDPEDAARALVAEANKRGGPDNISVIVVAVAP